MTTSFWRESLDDLSIEIICELERALQQRPIRRAELLDEGLGVLAAPRDAEETGLADGATGLSHGYAVCLLATQRSDLPGIRKLRHDYRGDKCERGCHAAYPTDRSAAIT